MNIIFHITTQEAWEQAQQAGEYRPISLENEGFIHFSTAAQVAATAGRYYRGQQGLVLLAVDADRAPVELRWETPPAGGERFPHLYGPLPLGAVLQAAPFPPEPDGSFRFPQELAAWGGRRILALIPAYNESERIQPVVSRTAAQLTTLVVDDGSRDATAALAEAAGAVVLRQTPNQGKGAALRAGFRWALERGWEAVLTLDADGQHDPQEIPAFLAADKADPADLLIGARDFHQMPFIRRLANTIGRAAMSWAVGQPVRDNQSGYRLISARLMQASLDSTETGYEFEVEMVADCLRRGWKLNWVPIRTIYAGQKSHIQPLQHTLRFFQLMWKTRRKRG